jgi:hypothetical protein
MHQRGMTTVLFLATIVFILITGCGGGDQSGSGSQQDGGSQAEQGQNASKKQGENAPKKKVVFGTVTFVNPKTDGFSVRPTIEEQGNKPVVFRLANETSITLDGNEAKLEDMKKGQQAQVEGEPTAEQFEVTDVRVTTVGETRLAAATAFSTTGGRQVEVAGYFDEGSEALPTYISLAAAGVGLVVHLPFLDRAERRRKDVLTGGEQAPWRGPA